MSKKPIAFMTRSLVDSTGRNLWLGIIEQSRETNTPIFTFRGPVLGQGSGTILYHLVDPLRFAGFLSWASSDVTQETINYYQRFASVPLVCLTFKIPGKPVIVMDCVSGMKDLMTHLIKVHNYKRIAFIRGPENHVYAKERYEGYLASLKENNITVNQRIISQPGGWGPDEGVKAINTFIDKGIVPGNDFDAVVCVGDNVAIGAQSQLIARGYNVPKDVAVCGYNGTDDAASMNPPLTTVSMPFFEQGAEAVRILNDMKSSKLTQEKYLHKTRLIISQSCGCHSQSALKAVSFIKKEENTALTRQKRSLFNFLKHKAQTTFNKTIDFKRKTALSDNLIRTVTTYRYFTNELDMFFRPCILDLTEKFVKEITDKTEEFIVAFDEYLATSTSVLKDTNLWQDLISDFDRFAREEDINLSYIQGILSQCRVVINETSERTERKKLLLTEYRENNLRQTASALLTVNNLPDIMNILCKHLSKLKIPSIYIALYQDPHYSMKNPIIPETSKLILAVRNGERLTLPDNGLIFHTRDILPEKVLPKTDFYSMVVESLHFQENFLGYVVFEHRTEDPVTFAALRDYLSSSIYSSVLMAERESAKTVLETTLKTMSSKADLLSNHSKTVTKAVTEISNTMDFVAKNIKEVSRNVSNVLSIVESAKGTVTQSASAMSQLVQGTQKISRAVGAIIDVAQKTDVLALNATIEAAHAGDAGMGFRVVAKEVKELALQTVTSTKQIIEIVRANNQTTTTTQNLITKTNAAIKDITKLSSGVMEFITKQVNSTQEVSSLLNNAVSSINEIANAIEEIAGLGDGFKDM